MPEYSWRRKCPATIEQIAIDFVENHCVSVDKLSLALLANIHDGDPWFAWRRRLSAIYGISKSYADPFGRPQQRGWNNRLWAKHETEMPDDLVERVFDATIILIRKRLSAEVR